MHIYDHRHSLPLLGFLPLSSLASPQLYSSIAPPVVLSPVLRAFHASFHAFPYTYIIYSDTHVSIYGFGGHCLTKMESRFLHFFCFLLFFFN